MPTEPNPMQASNFFLLTLGDSANVRLVTTLTLGCRTHHNWRHYNILGFTAEKVCYHKAALVAVFFTQSLGCRTHHSWRHFYHKAALVNGFDKRTEPTFVSVD